MMGPTARRIIGYLATQGATFVAKEYAVPYISDQLQKFAKDSRITGLLEIGTGMGLQYLADELDKRGMHPLITLLIRVTGMLVGAEGFKDVIAGFRGASAPVAPSAPAQATAAPVRVIVPRAEVRPAAGKAIVL